MTKLLALPTILINFKSLLLLSFMDGLRIDHSASVPNRIGNSKLSRDQTGGLVRTEQLSLFNPRGGNKRNNLILQIFSGQKLSRNPLEILGLSNHRNPILLYTITDSNGTELLQKQTDHTICFDHGYVPIYQRCRKLLLFSNWNKLPPKTSYHQQIESSQMSRRLWAEFTCILNYSSIVLVVYCNGI